MEEERLAAALVLATQGGGDELLVVLTDVRPDRAAALRRRLDHRDIAKARERHVQRARDGRRGESENVDLEAKLTKQLLLRHAEALLLVDEDKPEAARHDVAREDPMCADEDVDPSRGELAQYALHLRGLAEARHHLDRHRLVAVALAKRVPVLLRENRRRRENERLPAVDGGDERRPHGDLGLAEADVSAHESIHRPRLFHVLLDCLDRPSLVGRLFEREARLELLHEVAVYLVGDTRCTLSLRVERDQLTGELVCARTGPTLEQLPRLATELRECRRMAVRTHVPRDLADLFVGDVEAIVAPEGEKEIVARDSGDRLRLEPEQLADPVILVNDMVARTEVGEALECAAETDVAARRALAKDLGVGKENEPELTQYEAAARGRDREEKPGSAGRSSPTRSSSASTRRSIAFVRSASPSCANVTTTRLPALTKPARSFSASTRPRAATAGRCASKACCWLRQGAWSAHRVAELEVPPSSSRHTFRTSSSCQTRSTCGRGATRSPGTAGASLARSLVDASASSLRSAAG